MSTLNRKVQMKEKKLLLIFSYGFHRNTRFESYNEHCLSYTE